MKKKILIISGGISKEREISLQTGNQVAKELKKITINHPKLKLVVVLLKTQKNKQQKKLGS